MYTLIREEWSCSYATSDRLQDACLQTRSHSKVCLKDKLNMLFFRTQNVVYAICVSYYRGILVMHTTCTPLPIFVWAMWSH